MKLSLRTRAGNVISSLLSTMSKSRYLAVNVQSGTGRLVAPRFTRNVWTLPLRFDLGSARSAGDIASRFWLMVWGRKSVFWSTRLYEKFPVRRVRIGRLMPPPSVNVFAMLLGGSELCPLCGPVDAKAQPPASIGADRPKQGLSALTRFRPPLSNTESA